MVSLRGENDPLEVTAALEALDLVPRKGRLVPLRTKDEVRAALETFEAYVIELPIRNAANVKDLIANLLPDLNTSEFQHLRRFVQPKHLPEHLRKKFNASRGDLSLSEQESGDEDAKDDGDTVRFFLVSPTAAIAHADLLKALRQVPPWSNRKAPPRIFYVTVPALPPTSREQADEWSEKYWPIAYKNTNPFGPHPNLVQRGAAEIEGMAGDWLAMAQDAARKTGELGLGEPVGCVVVDNSGEKKEVVAVAGDCRWRSPTGEAEEKQGNGNVMAHAVQRAIALVAKKRLRAAGKDPDFLDRSLFCDSPITPLEQTHYESSNVVASGYLCVDLDIYITHEPCVMCSMAILHSRFKRCVFGRRMPKTGGLTADTVDGKVDVDFGLSNGGLGHGIFWRPAELNWKLLTWEFQDEDKEKESDMISDSIPDTLQA